MAKRLAKVLDLGQIDMETINAWGHQYKKTRKGFRCRQCRSLIRQTICYVSIHLKQFGSYHAGPGRVVRINYPYCPKCDGKYRLRAGLFPRNGIA